MIGSILLVHLKGCWSAMSLERMKLRINGIWTKFHQKTEIITFFYADNDALFRYLFVIIKAERILHIMKFNRISL